MPSSRPTPASSSGSGRPCVRTKPSRPPTFPNTAEVVRSARSCVPTVIRRCGADGEFDWATSVPPERLPTLAASVLARRCAAAPRPCAHTTGALAARSLGGVVVLQKGPVDVISDGQSGACRSCPAASVRVVRSARSAALVCAHRGSPRRCGGQGRRGSRVCVALCDSLRAQATCWPARWARLRRGHMPGECRRLSATSLRPAHERAGRRKVLWSSPRLRVRC